MTLNGTKVLGKEIPNITENETTNSHYSRLRILHIM
jgi:hypothetical protein